MKSWNRDHLRHIVMRGALGFVLAWFGTQELHRPGDWAVFVPHVIANRVPGAVDNLILLHGFLLVLAAAAVVAGLFSVLGAVLATALLGEVTLGLWMDGGGVSDLMIRDIGLIGLATAVALDPVRAWQLDGAIAARLRAMRPQAKQHRGKRPVPAPVATFGFARAVTGAALIAVVLLAAALLRATGSSGAPAGQIASVYHTSASATPAAQPTAAVSAQATPAAGQPTAAAGQPTTAAAPPQAATNTGISFDTWKYRQYAFEVYPGPAGSDAQKALSGFTLSVQDQGSQVTLVFKATTARYQDATIVLDKTNKAYFIETSMRDDPSNTQENDLGDDGVIVVNPQGFILKS